MHSLLKYLLIALGICAVLVLAAAWYAQRWLSGPEFLARVEQEASAAAGVAVSVGGLEVQLLPPSVSVDAIAVQTQPALRAQRLELRPSWSALLQGRLKLETVLLRGADLSQVGALLVRDILQKKKLSAPVSPVPKADWMQRVSLLPDVLRVRNLRWVSATGWSITLDGEAMLDELGQLEQVVFHDVRGWLQGAQVKLVRQGERWTLTASLGEGSLTGQALWQPASQPGAPFALTGQLEAKNLDLVRVLPTAPALTGLFSARTTLSAHGKGGASFLNALQTQSQFSVQQAVLHGFDLAKAVRTVGLSRGGETALNVLSGHLASHGRALVLTQLTASSGLLSATGRLSVAALPQDASPEASAALSGRLSVALGASTPGDTVVVPLHVGGTLKTPELSLSRGAMLGGALGTLVLPGVGTAGGANLGDRLSQGLSKLLGK